MASASGRLVLLYPIILAAAVVVGLFSEATAPLRYVVRPLAIAMIATALVEVALLLATRRPHVAAFVAAAFILFVAAPRSVSTVALFIVCMGYLAVWFRHRRILSLERLSAIVAPLVTTALVVGMVNVAANGPYLARSAASKVSATADLPDIYLVLLDGHPRLDTLRTEYGQDTSAFSDAMEAAGFTESTAAHSNYNLTFLTLASMFTGDHLDESVLAGHARSVMRRLTRIINTGHQLDRFRQAGYEIVSVSSSFPAAALLDVDRMIDLPHATDFDLHLLGGGGLALVTPDLIRDWAMDDHRSRVLETFDEVADLSAERVPGPRFIFAHVPSPHVPVAFAEEGAPVDGPPCFPTSCTLTDNGERYPVGRTERLRAQIAFIDRQVVDLVRTIEQRSARPAAIVIFSDHGMRRDFADDVEAFRSLLYSRTPSIREALPDDTSTVDLVNRLANGYLATGEPYAADEARFVDIMRIISEERFELRPAHVD